MSKHTAITVVAALLWAAPAEGARNFQLKGQNELCGGIGFAADLTDWTPGGFKWFNDYSRKLSKLTWLNFQFNVTTGGGGRDCWRDNRGVIHCDDDYWADHWRGTALELAAGVKLKWRVQKIPLQIHAKFGGAFDVLFFPQPGDDINGVAFGFRGGAGVRYFFVPTFGLGAEFVTTFGPAFLEVVDAEFYGAIDFNIGVEWRF